MNPTSNPMLIRKRVVKKALKRTPISHLARQYMVSRKFVYKWIRRYHEDPNGAWWEERSRRPRRIRRKVTPPDKREDHQVKKSVWFEHYAE
ncbi:MAG: helix-turn-helix domain-containing protein [Candidatus Heimdallarchaeaceae archaeon]